MPNDKRYVFALQFEDPDGFRDIFGDSVSSMAQDDVVAAYKEITNKLLQHYDILSDVVSPTFGRWYVLFAFKESLMPIDVNEQISALTAAGRQMIREMLQDQFGMATGTNIDFKMAIISLREDSTDAKSINQIIDQAIQSVSAAGSPRSAITRDEFIKIIERREIETYLQPIVSLSQGAVVGYEALSRGPAQSPVHRADLLFSTAVNMGLTQELELACVARALDWAVKVPAQYWLSINIGTAMLNNPAFWDLISREQLKPGLPRLVFELTEHLPIDLAKEMLDAVHNLKARGIRLALDDTGCGFANLFAVETLRPEIVKLCITVISRIGRSRDVAQEIQEIADRIAQLGGSTLGEGVERKDQVEVLKQCGVSLAQGYYFGHPKPAQEVLTSNT